MHMARLTAFSVLLSTLAACSSAPKPPIAEKTQAQEEQATCIALPEPAGGANPAAAYCEALGYALVGELCVFPDATSCEHWAFFRGQCGQAHSFCNLHGGSVSSVTENMGTWTGVHAVCSLPNGTQCTENSFAHTCLCESDDAEQDETACTALPEPAGGANPAAAYCEALGYALDGELCVFPDATSCEHWAFFRGQCGQAHSFCNLHGGSISSVTEDMGTWTAVQAVCSLPNGTQCTENSFAHTCLCE
jgi:putative hemolysin